MKYTFLIITFFIFSSLCAQSIDYSKKTHEVILDEKHLFDLVRECDNGQNCRFHVSDLNGTEIILINYRSFNSIVERTKNNPEGTVRYLEFVFLDSGRKAEYNSSVINPKRVAKIVHNNSLIVNGELDTEEMERFILVNGTPFSERIRL